MNLELSDEETAALATLLATVIDNDHFRLSPRVQTWRGILGKMRPQPVRLAEALVKHLQARDFP